MYDLKKVNSISQVSVTTLPITRPLKKVSRRAQPAINVRNPRVMMGLIFLFLLLAYLVAYAQEAPVPHQPYLVIEPPNTMVVAPADLGAPQAQPEHSMLIPPTGR